MSELDQDVKVDLPAQEQQSEVVAGNLLREARQVRGMTPGALASSLKVSVKKIEAIEAGRFDLLPDMVFARALAFSICRNLKTDAAPILANFPATVSPILTNDESGINAPFHSSQAFSKFAIMHMVSRPVALFSIVMLLLALSLYTASFFDTNKLEGLASATISKFNSPVQTQDKSQAQSVVPEEQLYSSNSALAPSLPVVKESVVSPGLVINTEKIVFKSRGTSWIEVVDAKGVVQLRKTLIAGEVVGASGLLPLAVVVGKADSLDVSVSGKPFNLMSVTKDNVARFEVK